MKFSLTFGSFSNNPHGVLAAVYRLALVGVELPLYVRLCIPPVWFAGELRVASFADSERWDVPDSLYDPKIAFRHIQSLAHSGMWA